MLTGQNAQCWSMAENVNLISHLITLNGRDDKKEKNDKICEFLLELNRFHKYCLFRRTKRKK